MVRLRRRAGVACDHPHPLPGGVCRECGAATCRMGLDGCRCLVGWPHELRCPECRDRKDRLDDGYCVCLPPRLPPRAP